MRIDGYAGRLRAAIPSVAVSTILLTGIAVAVAAVPSAAQIYRLPNPDERQGDFFGVSVDIEVPWAVVGASAADVCGENSGAAHLYRADSTTGHWNHIVTLVPDDCAAGDFFGRSLDLSGDRLVVAAFRPAGLTNRPNAAYVFERDTLSGDWTQAARITEVPVVDEGAFAAAVAIDGDNLLVTTSGDVIACAYHGAGYVYRPSGDRGDWSLWQRLQPTSDPTLGVFGVSAVMRDSVMVVGGSTYLRQRPGSAYFFGLDANDGRWKPEARLGGLDDFFLPVDVQGNRAIVGESRAGGDNSGRAMLFERDAQGRWTRAQRLRPVRPFALGAFGSNVALGTDRALVVGFDEQLRFEFNIDRVVYVFRRSAGRLWRQRHIVDVGEVSFGSDIAVDGSVAIIGQASDDQPGTAYIVQLQ